MKHNWEYKRMGDVATYINGYAFKPSDWLESGYPIIRIQNLNNSDAEYNYSDGNIPSKYFVSNGDLLISWSASLGAYIWHGEKAVLNQHIFKVLFDKTDIVKNYLKYFVDFSLPLMASKTHGATMKHITKPLFDALPIPFPNVEVQERIVGELDKINEVIEDCRELLRNLDALAQSLFYDFFGDPNTNPKGWEVRLLKDIVIGKLSYGSGASGTPYDNNVRYIRITDIDDYGNLKPEIASSPSVYDKNYDLFDGDILFARSGATVGKTFLYRTSIGKAIYAGYLIKASVNKNIISPIYLYALTKTAYYTDYIQRSIRGAAQPNVNAQLYGAMRIPVPPIELQEKFAARIEQIEVQKKAVEQTMASLQTLLDSRMDYWFN